MYSQGIILLTGGQGINNVITFKHITASDLQLTKFIIRGRDLERGKIMKKLDELLFLKTEGKQLEYLTSVNLEMSTPRYKLAKMAQFIVDFEPFRVKNDPYVLQMTLNGIFRLTKLELQNQTEMSEGGSTHGKTTTETFLKLYPSELCSTLAVNVKTHFVAVGTLRDGRYLNRIIVMEISTQMNRLCEVDCINYMNKPDGFAVGSFFKKLCFGYYFKGNPMILAYQYTGAHRVYSYYVENAKLERLKDPFVVGGGTIVDFARFGINEVCIDDAGNLIRLQIV